MKRTGTWIMLPLIALAGVVAAGCSASRAPGFDATRRAAVVSEVEAYFARYRETLNARETNAIADLYVGDDRFALHEDGTLKYPTVQSIIDALDGLPPGMTMSTVGAVTRVTPLTNDLATASSTYETTIRMLDGNTFEFGGVMTAVLERTDGGWKIVTAHTSTVRERR